MWPYLAWLVLANALNISIAARNPDVSASNQHNWPAWEKEIPNVIGAAIVDYPE